MPDTTEPAPATVITRSSAVIAAAQDETADGTLSLATKTEAPARVLSVDERLALLEDEIAYLRNVFGWPKKEDEKAKAA